MARIPCTASIGPRRSQSGFGLLLTLVAMGVTVLTLGAGIDFSHIYLVQGELQAMADEVALNAARELDGTAEGLERARSAGARRRHCEWFSVSTDEVNDLRFRFRTDPEAAWQVSPAQASGQRFVEVAVAAKAKLFFLPIVPTAPAAQRVVVHSIAGQVRLGPGRRTVLRYSIVAPEATAAGFGFAPGQPVPIQAESAGKCGAALAVLLRHDTDAAADDYSRYIRQGNGQRILTAEVKSQNSAAGSLGYATLLVPADASVTGECTGIYVGSSPVLNASRNGAGPSGLYEVRLSE